jgi:tetratricopeptide (TPR) repeat protein
MAFLPPTVKVNYSTTARTLSRTLAERTQITPSQKENGFHIVWHNVEVNTEDSFVTYASEITAEELETLWQKPQHQLEIGSKLFRFLDGDSHCLQKALDLAARQGEPLTLLLYTCSQTADWPFELLSDDKSFLLPFRLHLIRCVSDWGAEKEVSPQNRILKILFMACSALDVQPELDFEREEETIFKITEKLAVDMEVEDSGSLEGLREQLVKEQYDVVHLSGHAGIDKKGQSFFIMEDETGRAFKVSPDELWQKALIENPPQLLFLSGCRTGETPDNSNSSVFVSFAHKLVEQYHIPAALGWGRSVSDEQATLAEQMLYRELSRGKSILNAVQRARNELITTYNSSQNPAWPLLRLFGSSQSMGAMVKAGQKMRPSLRMMKHVYLEQSQVKVLAEGFVGRRRQIQHSLRALRQAKDKVGVLILGTGGLGKSCLAGKLCERFLDHTLIIVHGRLNAITLHAAMKKSFIVSQDEENQNLLASEMKLTDKLEKLCVSVFKNKNYLLLFDDFEQNLEGVGKGAEMTLIPEAEDLLKVLFTYLPFSGKMTHLIITSRYGFSISQEGHDLVKEQLEWVWLSSFHDSEQRKKARELNHIINYGNLSVSMQLLDSGCGNPRLMEWVNVLVGQMSEAEIPQLLESIVDKQEEFIRKHVIREILIRGGEDLARFLRCYSIYRFPVHLDGARHIGEKAGLEGWEELLNIGLSLSLIEYDQARESYCVTPLLKDELLNALNYSQIKSCHNAAFNYYREICEPPRNIDPILSEELIYHALMCGEEDIASEKGGELVMFLREKIAFRESKRIGEWIISEKKQGLSNLHDAFLLNETALTIKEFGEHSKAIDFFKKTLNIYLKAHGEKHPHVGTTLNNLGYVWDNLGNRRMAIDYYEKALKVDRTLTKEANPNVARDLNNLGMAWQGLGNFSKAIDYYKQALAVQKEVYGEEHQQIVVVMTNLGEALRCLGKPEKSLEYLEQALKVSRKVCDEKHPYVATILNNLGLVLDMQGEHSRALDYFKKALTIWLEVFDENHQQVAISLNNIGAANYSLGYKKQAISCWEQALKIDKSFFGDKHPNVGRTLNNLGSAWMDLGDYHKAIDYLEKALKIDRDVSGEEHPDVGRDLLCMGGVFFCLKQKDEAKKYAEQAFEIYKKFYGEGHPETIVASEFLKLLKMN